MKVSVLVLALLLFVAISNARPNLSQSDSSIFEDEKEEESGYVERNQEYDGRRRRTRHSRQIFYGYDYPWPSSYESHKNLRLLEEILFQVKKLTEEVSGSLKRQQAGYTPPQPIYIPYPVYIPALGSKCFDGVNNNLSNVPDTDSRFPVIFDKNQIWGIDQGENTVDNDDSDGTRPISLEPVNSNRPQGRPIPSVEHGSSQAGDVTTAAPTLAKSPAREPGICEAAILSCCRFRDLKQKECFTEYGCVKTYSTGVACSPKAIQAVIQNFKNAYAPS
ncbi:unnamed protein product [Parnassius apollo]|uniref:(apollo) hypothetical protein n=1 Tax=Parnassius apollo TaxID=110799 RepID=A0A8S3X1W6_PARAO|nr:unnamed protein product [Parnassius apollo]